MRGTSRWAGGRKTRTASRSFLPGARCGHFSSARRREEELIRQRHVVAPSLSLSHSHSLSSVPSFLNPSSAEAPFLLRKNVCSFHAGAAITRNARADHVTAPIKFTIITRRRHVSVRNYSSAVISCCVRQEANDQDSNRFCGLSSSSPGVNLKHPRLLPIPATSTSN